jgi:hypothetical protein
VRILAPCFCNADEDLQILRRTSFWPLFTAIGVDAGICESQLAAKLVNVSFVWSHLHLCEPAVLVPAWSLTLPVKLLRLPKEVHNAVQLARMLLQATILPPQGGGCSIPVGRSSQIDFVM